MYAKQFKAYESVNKTTMSGREIEASVLTKAAIRLKECHLHWNAEGHHDRLIAALKFNQQIWNIFQTELSDPGNPLPIELKRDLLRLSAFVDKRSFDIMAFPSPEKVTILIDINNNIAAGLRVNPSKTTSESPVQSVRKADTNHITLREVSA